MAFKHRILLESRAVINHNRKVWESKAPKKISLVIFFTGQISKMTVILICRLITHSEGLQELDLDDNLVGDLGGREILEALMDRKEGEV